MNAAQVAPENTDAENGLADWITPKRTALLLIDVQADFASPGGVCAKGGADLSAVPAALGAAGRLELASRRSGAKIVFVGLRTRAETDSPAWVERRRRLGGDPDEDLAICRAGTPGEAFVGPQPQAGDLVIRKRLYGAFFETALDAELRAEGIDTLVLAGLTTECCVEATAREAFHRGYHVFIVADACASNDSAAHQASLGAMSRLCAIVVDAGAVERAWGDS